MNIIIATAEDMLHERNRIIDLLDDDPNNHDDALHRQLGELDTKIIATPPVTTRDVLAKALLLTQFSAEGLEVSVSDAEKILREAIHLTGMGRVFDHPQQRVGT